MDVEKMERMAREEGRLEEVKRDAGLTDDELQEELVRQNDEQAFGPPTTWADDDAITDTLAQNEGWRLWTKQGGSR